MDATADDPPESELADDPPLESRADAWARRGLMCAILFPLAGLIIGITLKLKGDARGGRVLRWTGVVLALTLFIAILVSAADASAVIERDAARVS